ncbi:hypothetical protein [Kribbella sp. CA-247076]|uniref:hypothetical protein n=1 Tax=Kribbella sp. CA-247076 TaxID=3239941 RepID=UPI003D8B5B8A
MTHLTTNEQRHAESLTAIRDHPSLIATCGDCDELAEPLENLLPLYEHNEDWDEIELDEDLGACALRFTNLGAQWETADGLPELYGEFRILHFYDVFDQPEGPGAMPDATDFQREFLSELRSFDTTPRSGAGMRSYLRMRPGTTPLEIWYADLADVGASPYPAGYLKLELTYAEYLDALLLTKGSYGWQYLFADVSLNGPSSGSTVRQLEHMLEVLPGLFPGDYGELHDRLAERRSR